MHLKTELKTEFYGTYVTLFVLYVHVSMALRNLKFCDKNMYINYLFKTIYTCKYQKICEEKVLKGMMIKKKGLQ